jgi:hypothetical protein
LEEHPHSCLGRVIQVEMSQLSLCPSQSQDGSLKPSGHVLAVVLDMF